jgi:glucose/arabinose dehydrogenase
MNRFACACLIAATGTAANAQLTTELVASGIDRPVFMVHAGDGSGRLFIIEQEGQVRILEEDGTLIGTPWIDIDQQVTGGTSGGNEQGLLGLAFAPDFATSGLFYVNYTGSGGDTIVDEYTMSDPTANVVTVADQLSKRRIMHINQPFSNHNGGWIGFGPDGFLYVASGDGGSGNDPGNRAGNLTQRLGKLHRIDVSGADDYPADTNHNYAIPADNPFVGAGGNVHESIWDYGLRNPWRTSFDSATGDIWMADVGQNQYEEVNVEAADDAGGNHYGWRCREGLHATGLSCANSNAGFYEPIHEYSHGADGCSITGGYVYNGCALGDDYTGKYFFSDYCSGRIWTLDPTNAYARTTEFSSGFNVSSFGEDENGEIYVADLFAGRVYKIVDPNAVDADNNGIPDSCETTGCNDADIAEPFGTLNIFDALAFVDAYNNEDPIADFTMDGNFDIFDVLAFVEAYNAGC